MFHAGERDLERLLSLLSPLLQEVLLTLGFGYRKREKKRIVYIKPRVFSYYIYVPHRLTSIEVPQPHARSHAATFRRGPFSCPAPFRSRAIRRVINAK